MACSRYTDSAMCPLLFLATKTKRTAYWRKWQRIELRSHLDPRDVEILSQYGMEMHGAAEEGTWGIHIVHRSSLRGVRKRHGEILRSSVTNSKSTWILREAIVEDVAFSHFNHFTFKLIFPSIPNILLYFIWQSNENVRILSDPFFQPKETKFGEKTIHCLWQRNITSPLYKYFFSKI